jgi:hypothetical protein
VLIRVLCKDKSAGQVEDSALDELIRKGVVIAFFRPESNEWVDVRKSTLRKEKEKPPGYAGPERRKERGK